MCATRQGMVVARTADDWWRVAGTTTVASPDEGSAVEPESGAGSATAGPSSSQESNRTSLPNDVGDTAGSSCGGGEAKARGGPASQV